MNKDSIRQYMFQSTTMLAQHSITMAGIAEKTSHKTLHRLGMVASHGPSNGSYWMYEGLLTQ